MRRSSVIRVDSSVAQSAFLLGDLCPCEDVRDVCLSISRMGKESEVGRYRPLYRDDDGYLVFEWDQSFKCMDDGLYLGAFERCGEVCATVMMDIKRKGCKVLDAYNKSASACNSPDHLCESGQSTCGDCGSCEPEVRIYIPRYDIERGC